MNDYLCHVVPNSAIIDKRQFESIAIVKYLDLCYQRQKQYLFTI